MKRNVILFALLLLNLGIPGTGKAQEMLGATLGNYAGTDAIQLNPSALHNSKQYLDIRILGLDAFVQNNYLYQSRNEYRLSNFFTPGYEFPTHPEEYGSENRIFYTYQNKRNKDAFMNGRLNGPGFMLIWDRHAFALTTAVRSVSSLYGVPYDLANFVYLGLNYIPQQNINYHDTRRFTGGAAGWAEIGLTYSYIVKVRNYDRWAIGATVRKLLGYAGGYVVSDDLNYLVPDDSTLIVKNLDAEMGIAIPMNYRDNSYNQGIHFLGGGFGFDFGFTYTRLLRSHTTNYYRRPCEPNYEDYLYRLGVALIDIGRIHFKDNAEKMNIDNRSSYWSNVNQLEFTNLQSFLDTVSYQFYGDSKAAYSGTDFKVWLPSALSVQFDYHYFGPWYVNASMIYGFPLAKASIHRPAQIAITPRYEKKWFEANLPVSVYNWDLVRVGLALRFYILTVGTEKLGYFFHLNDFTGMDFYFSIKIPFDKGSCKARGPKGCPAMDNAPSVKKSKKKKS